MRALILALLVAGPASAQAPETEERVVFTRAQLEELQKELNAIVLQREQAAFKAGVDYQKQACRSLI